MIATKQVRKRTVIADTAHTASAPVAAATDPKGRVVLATFGKDALLFRGGEHQPYVVAHGYDAATGEWSHGRYLDDLGHAYEIANPEIIEQASTRWQVADVRAILKEHHCEASDGNVAEVLASERWSRPVARSMKESATIDGWEHLAGRTEYLIEEGRLQPDVGGRTGQAPTQRPDTQETRHAKPKHRDMER